MGWIILLAVLAIPFAEIAVFIMVGSQIGVLATLAAVIAAGLIGFQILRWQGLSVLTESRAMMARGEIPARQIADTMMLALAGFLLMLPGFLSDIVGFALLVPHVRQGLYWLLSRNMVVVTSYGGAGGNPGRPGGAPPTIELGPDNYRGD